MQDVSGGAISDGQVFLLLDRQTVPLELANISKDGQFVLTLDESSLIAGSTATLGALAPGYLRSTKPIPEKTGERKVVDFVLDRGLSMHGQVMTPDGRPVPDLPLFLTTRKNHSSVLRTGAVFENESERYASNDYHESTTRTDSDGRFSATGLGPGQYSFWTPSEEWFIEQLAPKPSPSPESVHLVARSASVLDLFVAEEGTGRPVDKFLVEASVRASSTPYTLNFIGSDGHARTVWMTRLDGLEQRDGATLDLVIRADGYRLGRATGSLRPGEREVQIRATLLPMAMSSYTLEVSDRAGRPVDSPLSVDLEDVDAPGDDFLSVPLDHDPTARTGVHTLRFGVGRWQARVYPRGSPMSDFLAWSGEIQIPPASTEGTSPLRVMLSGEFGPLVIRKAATLPALMVMFRAGPKHRFGTMLRQPETTMQAVATGTWPYEVTAEGYRRSGVVVVEPVKGGVLDLSDDR